VEATIETEDEVSVTGLAVALTRAKMLTVAKRMGLSFMASSEWLSVVDV
jgi:hypothetical protein